MLFGKYVNKYYFKYFFFFLFGIIALIVVDYFQLLIPEIYGEIINALSENTLINDLKQLNIYMYQLGGIALVMFIGRFTWRHCIFGAAIRIESDIREEMFLHSEKLSQSYYKEHKTGGLMALFTNDLQTINASFGSGTIMLIDALFLGIMAFYKMWRMSWVLSLVAIVPMILICCLSSFVGKIMTKKFETRQQAYEDLSDFTQENFSGISVVKAFVKETQEVKAFLKINQNNYDKNIDFAKFSTILNVLISAIFTTIIVVLVGGCSYLVIYTENFKPGHLSEYIAYFSTLTWPMMAIAQLINMRAQGKASLNRITRMLNEEVEIIDQDVVSSTIKGEIRFNHLNFTYPDGNSKVLDDVTFHIKRGEMVGIIGKTGCGKTTIVDLLLRIYNVNKGELFLDEIDIMNLPFKSVRDAIGYVPQDNFLFSDTIKNNIGFAFEKLEDDQVIKAADMADVHLNIKEFDQQYQTILGERGVTLSGGQKQRVSIARAIVKDPTILILDDSVSAVDTKTEESILQNLRNLRRDKTTILIAHRISTVKDLDKIVVLDNGKVLAVGSHDELIKTSKEYQEMVNLQSLEKEINGGENGE